MSGRQVGRSRAWQPVAVAGAVAGAVLLALALAGCGEDGNGAAADVGGAEMTSPTPSSPGPSGPTPSSPGPSEPSPTSKPPTPDPTPDPTSGPTGSPRRAKGVLTMADNGTAVRMAVGESVRLQLDPPWRWETPTVRGDAVVVYPVNNIMDSGHQEWIIQAVKPGTAVVRAFGDAMCPPGAQCFIGDKIVQITVRVTS
ncbi:MAG TPA: hypothetical protein VKG85_09635 [Actinomycetes bacterium]|nr:hypothetical protein [Actinomycetes bacterium]